MKYPKLYFSILLVIGVLYLGISIWFALWKPSNADQIFLSHPISILLIAISLIYFTKGESIKSWFIQKPVRFYWISMLIAFFIIVPLGILYKLDYKNDVLVEAHGLLFDLIVFGILLSVYDSIKSDEEKKKQEADDKSQKIERYIEEIDDFRRWKSEEAKIRIRGNIYRLNKLNHTKLDLAYIKLDQLDLKDLKLSESNLFQNDFSNSNLANSEFKNITCSASNFIGRDTFLLNAYFNDSHIQYSNFQGAYLNGADFSNAKLSSIDFRGANLKNINFEKTYFYDPKLDGAEVREDFIVKLKSWKITGHPIYDWYEIIKREVPKDKGHFQYFLKEKGNIDKEKIIKEN